MSYQRPAELLVVLVTALAFLEVRLQGVIGLLIDDAAAVDNLLSALHDARGQWYGVEQVAVAGLAACLVIDEVGHDIVVQVTLLQLFFVAGYGRV